MGFLGVGEGAETEIVDEVDGVARLGLFHGRIRDCSRLQPGLGAILVVSRLGLPDEILHEKRLRPLFRPLLTIRSGHDAFSPPPRRVRIQIAHGDRFVL